MKKKEIIIWQEGLLKKLEEAVLRLGADVEKNKEFEKTYYTLDTNLIKGKKVFYFNC
jgi:hypothetical protein